MAQTVRRNIVTIGASSGGIEPLMHIVGRLPRDLAASVFVVVHVAAHARSELPAILSRAGNLAASHPQDNEPIEHGHIYVAPPDFHVVLNRETLRVVRGPRVEQSPTGDRSAISQRRAVFGPRVIGIVILRARWMTAPPVCSRSRTSGVSQLYKIRATRFFRICSQCT